MILQRSSAVAGKHGLRTGEPTVCPVNSPPELSINKWFRRAGPVKRLYAPSLRSGCFRGAAKIEFESEWGNGVRAGADRGTCVLLGGELL
jgi:hypothetical protein